MASSFSSSSANSLKPSRSQQFQNALGGFFIEQADVARINHVERDADGDGFAVGNLEMRKLLQFVRRPMAEIQRARGTDLKRVAARGDVVEMQFGAAADEMFHRGRLERGEFFRVAFDFVEEICVADAGDFHGLDIAGAFVARFERGEQIEIVDDGERRREGADEILFAEGVDAIFHADAGIGLRQGRGRDADMAHAAMRGGGGESGDVQQRAAADGDEIRMAVNVMPVDLRVRFR